MIVPALNVCVVSEVHEDFTVLIVWKAPDTAVSVLVIKEAKEPEFETFTFAAITMAESLPACTEVREATRVVNVSTDKEVILFIEEVKVPIKSKFGP